MESNFKKHDNIDRDVIEVSKDTLMLKLQGGKEFYSSTQAAWGFGGLAVTLLFTSFLTEKFVTVLWIPGETIRAACFMLGVVCSGIAVRNTIRWYRGHGKYEPQTIVDSLLEKKNSPTLALPPPSNPEPRKKKRTKASIPSFTQEELGS